MSSSNSACKAIALKIIILFVFMEFSTRNANRSPAVSVSKETVVDSRSNCLQKRPAPPIKQSIIPRDITRLFKQEPAQSRKPSGSRKVVAGPDTTRPSSSGKPVIRDSEFLHSEEALWIKSRAKTTAGDRPSGTTKKRPVPRPAETARTSEKPVIQRDSEFLHSEDALWIRSRAHASAKDNQDRECRSSRPRTREAATAEGKKPVIRPEVVKSSTSGKSVVQRDSEFLHSEEALWIKSRRPASAKEKRDGKRKSSSSCSKEVTADGKPVVRPGTAKPSASGKAVIQRDSEFLHSEDALWIKSRTRARAKEKSDSKHSRSDLKGATADRKTAARPEPAKPATSGKTPAVKQDTKTVVPRPLPKPPTAGSKPDVQNQNNSAEAAAGRKPNLQHSSGHPQARQATVTATTIAKTADINGKPSKTSCAKTAASRVRSASLPEESGSANPGLSQGPPAETPAAQPKPKRHRKVKKPAIKKAELPPQMPVTPYIPMRYTPGTDCSSNMAGQHPRVADGAVYLNRYEFVKKLGYGAYGMVVKVFDRESQEHKAIKMIDLGTKKSEHKLLRAEIKVLNWLKEKNTVDNVHIVMMESVFQYKNSLCPVLPLYAYDLRTMMKKSKAQTWTLRMLQTVARQLLTALIFLSSSGVDIVHCDIKPENIMLADTKKCDVKLIDFGLALHRSECRKGLRLQTRYYRAPEVVFGTDFDAAIDVWSLGVVLCELYTGKGLFRAKDEKGLVGEFVEVLGECPKKILDKGKFTNRYFDKKDDGEYELTRSGTNAAVNPFSRPLDKILTFAQAAKSKFGKNPSEKEFDKFFDLVKRMLAYDAESRINAQTAYSHPFINPKHETPAFLARQRRREGAARAPESPPPADSPSSQDPSKKGIVPTIRNIVASALCRSTPVVSDAVNRNKNTEHVADEKATLKKSASQATAELLGSSASELKPESNDKKMKRSKKASANIDDKKDKGQGEIQRKISPSPAPSKNVPESGDRKMPEHRGSELHCAGVDTHDKPGKLRRKRSTAKVTPIVAASDPTLGNTAPRKRTNKSKTVNEDNGNKGQTNKAMEGCVKEAQDDLSPGEVPMIRRKKSGKVSPGQMVSPNASPRKRVRKPKCTVGGKDDIEGKDENVRQVTAGKGTDVISRTQILEAASIAADKARNIKTALKEQDIQGKIDSIMKEKKTFIPVSSVYPLVVESQIAQAEMESSTKRVTDLLAEAKALRDKAIRRRSLANRAPITPSVVPSCQSQETQISTKPRVGSDHKQNSAVNTDSVMRSLPRPLLQARRLPSQPPRPLPIPKHAWGEESRGHGGARRNTQLYGPSRREDDAIFRGNYPWHNDVL